MLKKVKSSEFMVDKLMEGFRNNVDDELISNEDYLYIILHVSKTGGSTIRQHLHETFSEEELLLLYVESIKKEIKNPLLDNRGIIKKYLSTLSNERKDKVKVIYGHAAFYGVHKFFNKKARYICFLREPFSRVVSLYNYKRWIIDHNHDLNWSNFSLIGMDGDYMDFQDWVVSNDEFQYKFFLMQYLNTEFKGDLSIFQSVKDVLDKFYFVGISENSDEDFLYLYGLLGVKKFLNNENVSKKYISLELAKSSMHLLPSEFSIEKEVYDYAKELNLKFKKQSKDFHNIIDEMNKIKSKQTFLNDSKSKVSIILPSYNYGWCIAESIDSVIMQDFNNWELIIVDDGSSDNSIDIINKYVQKHPQKIKLYTHHDNRNLGLTKTYKFGLSKCSGEYVAFIESDDVWAQGHLSSKIDIFNDNKDVVLVYNNVELFGDKRLISNLRTGINYIVSQNKKLSSPFYAFKCFLDQNYVLSFSCFMVRKCVLKKVIFSEKYSAWLDWWLLAQMSLYGRFYFQDKRYTRWRIHTKSYNRYFHGLFNYDVSKPALNIKSDILRLMVDSINGKLIGIDPHFLNNNTPGLDRRIKDYFNQIESKPNKELKCFSVEKLANISLIGSKVRIDASTICQLNCHRCPSKISDENNLVNIIGKGFLGYSQFKGFIDQNPNIKWIELSNWGEIFLNPELSKIMKYAYENDVLLTANVGANLNSVSEETLEDLVKYKFKQIVMSIDGASQKTYQLYRVGGDLRKVIRNIKTINKFKKQYNSEFPNLIWKFIVFGHNEHEIPEVKKLAKSLGVRLIFDHNIDPNYSPIRDFEFVNKETGLNYVSSKHYEIDPNSRKLVFCQQLWDSPQINYNGDLLGCCANQVRSFGNVFDEGLDNCLNSDDYKRMKKLVLGSDVSLEGLPCKNCSVFKTLDKIRLKKSLLDLNRGI